MTHLQLLLESTMNTTHNSPASKRMLRHLGPGAIAALTLFASVQVHSMGDATDAEVPSVRPSVDAPLHGDQNATRTSMDARSPLMSQRTAERALRNSPTGDAYANEWLPVAASMDPTLTTAEAVAAVPPQATSRAEVRETLAIWRAAGLLTPQSDIGDTNETLQRREEFYASQTEVIRAEFVAAAERAEEEAQAMALLQAEEDNAAIMAAVNADSSVRREPMAAPTSPTATGTTTTSVGDDGEMVIVEIVEIDD